MQTRAFSCIAPTDDIPAPGSASPSAPPRSFSALIPQGAGLLSVASGAVTIFGWYAHSLAIIQILPDYPPMQFNTAVGFILSGLGLILISSNRPRPAIWPAAVITLLGVWTLAEYATGRNLGLDQLLFKSYFQVPGARIGQMSPLTAGCFAMIGTATIISAAGHSRARLVVTGLFACLAAVIPCVALFGFIFGIETADGWGVSTRMAVLTAPTFVLLTICLLIWAWQQARRENLSFLRWLPVTASVTLMAMVALTSAISFNQLKKSSDLRQHSYEVLAVAHTFLNDIYDATRGMRAFVLTGRPDGLETYQAGVTHAPGQLQKLHGLVRDNPGQTAGEWKLERDFEAVRGYAQRLIYLRSTQGMEPAIQLESTGEGFTLTSVTLADLRAFTGEEERLLKERSAKADGNLQDTVRVMIFGSALAAILLLVANGMASREVNFRRRAEVELHEKNIELQAAAQAKNSFLANMSHELRTPLNGIIGFSEILVDGLPGKVNAEQKEYLGDILTSGQHLLQLINDVLDLAKVEAGKMEIFPESFLLSEAIQQVCAVTYPLVQEKKIKLTTTIAPGLDRVVLDQKKLKQILYNLLSNAVKFTGDRGTVEIVAMPVGDTEFSLAIRDSGIGIRPENIRRLFKEFEQLEEGTTRRYQGTGLGLALTRKMVEIQGGRIDVESEFGRGTTFRVTLPLAVGVGVPA